MVCHTFEVLSRSCSLPAGNRELAVQEQWPSATSGRTFGWDWEPVFVTVTTNRTADPPGTSPFCGLSTVTLAVTGPLAEPDGAGGAWGVDATDGVVVGAAGGADGVALGDAVATAALA